MVLKVSEYMEEEKQYPHDLLIERLPKSTTRSAEATDTSKATIKHILSEGRQDMVLVTPGKLTLIGIGYSL